VAKQVRLAAGRARALGVATRGTTNPNRLRRMDRWIVHRLGPLLLTQTDALVIDLGYGASPVTTVELAGRLREIMPAIRVLGLEIDPARVDLAQAAADPPALEFRRGGFELAGQRPLVVRAANVLRQYDEPAALSAWETLQSGLAAGGMLVEGTCDEIGRLGSWVLLDAASPISLTLACRVSTLDRPVQLAERLPKALIHHNVPGQPVHEFLRAFDSAWDSSAALAPFGARQRWTEACARMATQWPVLDRRPRWRLGELTVAWPAVAPQIALR
jgi:hypothetical protein